MVGLLLILVGILTYLLFSPTSIIGPWLDRLCQDEKDSWKALRSKDKKEKWAGEDIEPHYQEGIPFTPSLNKPFDDPEVPNRPAGKKK